MVIVMSTPSSASMSTSSFRMTRREKLTLIDLALCSSLGTNDWRRFSSLARRKLATIQKGGHSDWLGDMRSVKATDAGRALAETLMSDVSLWLDEACEHWNARKANQGGQRGWCRCTSCAISRRMRPTNE
jgi:hypothetical protein